jgi:hypothetical protein
MRFFSDNAAPACPEVMAALASANHVDTAYDGDALSARLNRAFSELFETEVEALWVATGTAANSLALAALCPPYGSIICHRDAHIQNDECGAPEFYTHGAKLVLGDGEGAKLSPETVEALIGAVRKDVHQCSRRRFRSPMRPNMASSTHRTKWRRWASCASVGGLVSTWTVRASPMRWRGWAARRPTSPGGRGLTRSRSASLRMAACRPRP